MSAPDAPREPQPCQYGVDHDQNICGYTPTKLFMWPDEPDDHYEWRCEDHDPTRYPPTNAVQVDSPREPYPEAQIREVLVDAMSERGTTCLCGRPTKNRRYCSQECYRKFRATPAWKNSVPPEMRRKLLRMLEEAI